MSAGRSATSGNKTLSSAKSAKNDEFYTQLNDISNELKHYKAQFRGKVVLCNCDDPYESNFFKYFALNFNQLGLKKLIATSYAGSSIVGRQLPLLEMEGLKPEGKEPYLVEINEVWDYNGDGATDELDVALLLKVDKNSSRTLKGDDLYAGGDFRSRECVEVLESADIVVTNPPFSLFREYIQQLAKFEKQFLIIGNQNSITYKEVFLLIKDNLMWLGVDNGGTKWFQVPEDYEIQTESRIKFENGIKYFSMGSIMWFTNLDHSRRHEKIPLFRRFSPEEYPKYDNYDAIEVSKVADIPVDYDGMMGVPITFLDKYNPEQFEIIGITKTWFGLADKIYGKQIQVDKDGKRKEVTKLNDGPVLLVENIPVGKTFYEVGDKKYIQMFARVLVKLRK